MNSSTYRFSLDLHSIQSQISLPVLLGETGRTLRINLSDGGKPYTITDGCLVKISIKRPTGTRLEDFCTIEDNTTIVYPFSQNTNTAAVEGIHDCDVTLYDPDGDIIGSPRFTMVVSERVVKSDDIIITDEDFTAVEAMLVAEASRATAEKSRVKAESIRAATWEEIVAFIKQAELDKENEKKLIPTQISDLENDVGYISNVDFPNLFYEQMLVHGLDFYSNISEGIEYTLSDDENYWIVSGVGTCTDKEIVLPPFYQKLPVREIAAEAFASNQEITTMVIPNSILTIGERAFASSALECVTLGNGVNSVGRRLFDGCSKLREVSLSKALTTLGVGMFRNCTALESIVIEGNISTIGASAFEGCNKLSNIVFSKNVLHIQENAFQGCTSLVDINLPSNLDTIRSYAFADCTNLDASFLSSCDNLTTIGMYAFTNCKKFTDVKICDSVTSIGLGAFSGCDQIATMSLSFTGERKANSTYTNFGYIFGTADYTKNSDFVPITLKNVVFTGTSIKTHAFRNCTNIENITFTDKLASIGKYAFNSCSTLRTVLLPDSVSLIDYAAFQYCTNLTSVSLGNSVATMAGSIFDACSSLVSINLPNSLTSMGTAVFRNCTSLESITIPDSITIINQSTFKLCTSLKSVTIGKNVQTIGPYAFIDCSSLTSIDLPSGITSIGVNVFYNNANLTTINCGFAAGTVNGAPWGATNALITYNYGG